VLVERRALRQPAGEVDELLAVVRAVGDEGRRVAERARVGVQVVSAAAVPPVAAGAARRRRSPASAAAAGRRTGRSGRRAVAARERERDLPGGERGADQGAKEHAEAALVITNERRQV